MERAHNAIDPHRNGYDSHDLPVQSDDTDAAIRTRKKRKLNLIAKMLSRS